MQFTPGQENKLGVAFAAFLIAMSPSCTLSAQDAPSGSVQPLWTQYVHITEVDSVVQHLETAAETMNAGHKWASSTVRYLSNLAEPDDNSNDLTVGATGIFNTQGQRTDVFEYRRTPKAAEIKTILKAKAAERGIEIDVTEVADNQWMRSAFLLKRSLHTKNGKVERRMTRGHKPIRTEYFREEDGYLFSSRSRSLFSAQLPTVNHDPNIVFSFEASFNALPHPKREQLLKIRESRLHTQCQRGDNESISSWLPRLLAATADLQIARDMLSGDSQLSTTVEYNRDSEEFEGRAQLLDFENVATMIKPLRTYKLNPETTENDLVHVWLGFSLAPSLSDLIREFLATHRDELSSQQQSGFEWLQQQRDIEAHLRICEESGQPPSCQLQLRCREAAFLLNLTTPLRSLGINSTLRSDEGLFLFFGDGDKSSENRAGDWKIQKNIDGRILAASIDLSRLPSLAPLSQQLGTALDTTRGIQSIEDAVLSAILTTSRPNSDLKVAIRHTGQAISATAKTDVLGAKTLLNSWLPLFDRLRSGGAAKLTE